MSKSSGLVAKIGGALRSLGLRPMWGITGPTSSPEYMSHLPQATEYRVHAPTSQPGRAIVPQAEPDHVYDIKYYNRDTRRAYLPGGSMVLETVTVVPQAKEGEEGSVEEAPLTAGKPMKFKGQLRSILDNDHNGYTL